MSIPFPPGLFRIVLALIVCVSHLSRLDVGQMGVFLFFMLSGFWSVRMYHEKYLRLPSPRTTFWIARFLRIWILYAICQVIAIGVIALVLGEYEPRYWYGVLLLGVASTGHDILGVSWSLDIEEQFYLLVPLCAAFLAGTCKGRAFGLLVLGAVGLTIMGWVLIHHFGLVLIPAFVLPFLAGAVIYYRDMHVGGRMALVTLAAFIAIAIAVVAFPATYGLLDKLADAPFDPRWFALAWSLVLIPFVAWNVRQPSSKLDRHLGNLSFSIYLVHYPFYRIAHHLLDGPSAVEKLALLVLTIPLALVPYLLIDRVVERRREAWSRRLAEKLTGTERPAASA